MGTGLSGDASPGAPGAEDRPSLRHLEPLHLCPYQCLVDRHHGERGLCRTGDLPVTSSYGPHFGEEGPLVGRKGSSTIFFTHCNLYCLFCQNYQISHGGEGERSPLPTWRP